MRNILPLNFFLSSFRPRFERFVTRRFAHSQHILASEFYLLLGNKFRGDLVSRTVDELRSDLGEMCNNCARGLATARAAFFVALCRLPTGWVGIRTRGMNRRIACLLPLLGFLVFSACHAEKVDETTRVRLKTNKGDIVLELNAEKAPATVENFKKYVAAGHYDGTVFHRVIEDFMIQGGGFALEDDALVQKKTGKGVVNESENGLKNEIGTVAMARTADVDSATAQFFINVANNHFLNHPTNGGYTVFGKVVEGMDVVNQIKVVKTQVSEMVMLHPVTGEKIPDKSKDVPIEPIIIESASVE